jgi:hypothetical protein
MPKLRLEVLPDESVKEICTQAARIATHIGVEVVFEYNGKDVTAKPGMEAGSLAHECQVKPADQQSDGEKLPPAASNAKATGKRAVKEKKQLKKLPLPPTLSKRMCKKKAYKDARAARTAIRTLSKFSERDKVPTRSYLCPYCNQYHLTSKPKRR